MQLIRSIRARRFKPLLQEQEQFYSQARTPDQIASWQLEKFNEQWQSIRHNVPYWSKLARDRSLPEQFETWDKFKSSLPFLDRALIQSRGDELRDGTRVPDYFRITGGSTAEPIQIPAWQSELTCSNRDVWFARSWFGISPADKLFLIWGHSHLLGSGWRGKLNGLKREVKDVVLGYRRHSAYDLSDAALRAAGESLLRFRPAYVIGYAVALDRFARVNTERRDDFRKLGLKVVIPTAESFPSPDSARMVAETFGCPVAMEYGTVETGVIAQQQADGGYRVFWRHYFLETLESTDVPGAWEILLTTLYPRCFPLVRYRIGDLVVPAGDVAEVTQRFAAVIGRCNDAIVLADGTLIHSEAFTHAIKECAGVSGFQVEQVTDGKIKFRFLAREKLDRAEQNEIRRRLGRIHRDLENILLEQVEALEQSVAGKTRRIMRGRSHGR